MEPAEVNGIFICRLWNPEFPFFSEQLAHPAPTFYLSLVLELPLLESDTFNTSKSTVFPSATAERACRKTAFGQVLLASPLCAGARSNKSRAHRLFKNSGGRFN